LSTILWNIHIRALVNYFSVGDQKYARSEFVAQWGDEENVLVTAVYNFYYYAEEKNKQLP
jgi:hypothetical protein